MSWRRAANRDPGSSDGYVFGDIFRIAKNSLIGSRSTLPEERATLARMLSEEGLGTRSASEGESAHGGVCDSADDTSQTRPVHEDHDARLALAGAMWPDPDPELQSHGVYVDDVTRMNSTPVFRICFVRSVEDVKAVLAAARERGLSVSMRGAQHCMGGHTIARGGYVLDMSRLNHIDYDAQRKYVRAGPGATWADLIAHLNQHGRSPRTMQSYSSFSVGGTVSVNAHGITTDYCCHESVVELRLILWDGREVRCTPDAEGDGSELFSLAVGGFGLFGVIVEVTLTTVPNTHLHMDMLHCSVDEFPDLFDGVKEAGDDVEIKLARLDNTTMRDINFFVFRRASRAVEGTVSALPLQPRAMTTASQVLYKWVMPALLRVRFTLERNAGRAADWSNENERNSLMFESAEPLARLYSPALDVDDSFVLQEYFIPKYAFHDWLAAARSTLLSELEAATLLNITIRFVEHDTCTALPYARDPEGCFAFVFYFRIRRGEKGDAALQHAHTALAHAAIDLGGTFYLPYRHHYSDEQLRQAHPHVEEFFRRKQHFDPHGLFRSLWFDRYGAQYCDFEPLVPSEAPGRSCVDGFVAAPSITRDIDPCHAAGEEVTLRRTDSFKRLHRDPWLRRLFYEGFLVSVFNVENRSVLQSAIGKALWSTTRGDDLDTYLALVAGLEQQTGGVLATATRAWRSVSQLRSQKRDLLRQTASILSRVGRLGRVRDYACIGDYGKTVIPFRQALGVDGNVYVVHDRQGDGPAAAAERGSAEPVGQFVHIQYDRPDRIALPDACVDLVTMNQGLHHLPLAHLPGFLREVHRILRPGGVFILREHDATARLVPLLDLAHSVFNAVTGVSAADERNEIRAFRSILHWRRLLQFHGFLDSMVYDVDPLDCTQDEMMCFLRPPRAEEDSVEMPRARNAPPRTTPCSPPSPPRRLAVVPPRLAKLLSTFRDQAPGAVLEGARTTAEVAGALVLRLASAADDTVASLAEPHRSIIGALVSQFLRPIVAAAADSPRLLDLAVPGQLDLDPLPREVSAALEVLLDKAASGQASMTEATAAAFVREVRTALCAMFPSTNDDDSNDEGNTNNDDSQVERNSPADASHRQAELERAFSRVLRAHPVLAQADATAHLGLSRRARLFVESAVGVGPWTAHQLAAATAPWLDDTAVRDALPALDEVVADPASHPPSLEAITDESSPWFRAGLAFLGAPRVQLSRVGRFVAASAGLRPVVDLWRTAQQARASRSGPDEDTTAFSSPTPGTPAAGGAGAAGSASGAGGGRWARRRERRRRRDYEGTPSPLARASALSEHHRGLLVRAVRVFLRADNPEDREADAAALTRCLDGTGIISRKAAVRKSDFTWYKLPEWLQVEMVQVFGAFMEHTPWYRFPFLDFLRSYFSILASETRIVAEQKGWRAAVLSSGFFTDAVPGIAMSLVLGQMALLAAPLRATLGDGYTAEQLQSQVERLVVTVTPGSQVNLDRIHPGVCAHQVVESLWVVDVPSLYRFTAALMALSAWHRDVTILAVSGHDVVQVRVSIPSVAQLEPLTSLRGVRERFRFTLPTDGSTAAPETQIALEVRASALLCCLRKVVESGAKVVQVYDFW